MKESNRCGKCQGSGTVERWVRPRGWLGKLRRREKTLVTCIACGGLGVIRTIYRNGSDAKPTAREFYYASIAPEEKGKSYQKLFHRKVSKHESIVAYLEASHGQSAVNAFEGALTHQPNLSN